MSRYKSTMFTFWWLVIFVLFAVGVTTVFYWTPKEQTMGVIQKIFYLHLPVAINAFIACMITFMASVAYLFQRRQCWDDLAVSSAKVAVLLCTIVLFTGMLWGRSAWGHWWTWSPRLTFSLVLWLLYVVYVAIRPAIESRHRRAIVSAVYGVIAFLDVPLVYLSVRLMPDIHPSSITLAPEMKMTLGFWFMIVTPFTLTLIWSRYQLQRRLGKLDQQTLYADDGDAEYSEHDQQLIGQQEARHDRS